MDRRTFVTATALGSVAASAGCLDRTASGDSDGGSDGGVETEFGLVDTDVGVEDPPEIEAGDGTVTVRGTVRHGSSQCGTVALAHAGYEASQQRLDLLVVAADDSDGADACTDDLVDQGYRVEATVPEEVRRVAATEHHVFGETYAATLDLTA